MSTEDYNRVSWLGCIRYHLTGLRPSRTLQTSRREGVRCRDVSRIRLGGEKLSQVWFHLLRIALLSARRQNRWNQEN